MELAKIIPYQQQGTATAALNQQAQGMWTQIFDPYAAIVSMWKEVEKKASSYTTRHTARQYRICLYDFLRWSGATVLEDQSDKTRIDGDYFDFSRMRLHSEDEINRYIVDYCFGEKQRSPKTINKYLAAIRQYIRKLRNQPFFGITGDKRWLIQDVKEMLDLSMQVKAPDDLHKTVENRGRVGIWLNKSQVREIANQFNPALKKDARDKAIMAIAFEGAFRVSELARIRLSNIKRGKDCWEIRVMGKRNNISPVGISDRTYELIHAYVDLYNADLDDDDPRRIQQDNPLWQPLRHGDNYSTIGVHRYDPKIGLRANGIRRMFVQRTPAALKEELGLAEHEGIKPHDARRTVINGLLDSGVPLKTAQRVARHSDISTTGQYLPDEVNLATALLGNIWDVW